MKCYHHCFNAIVENIIMPKIGWLRHCIDYFISYSLYQNDNERYRARILVGCLISIAGIAFITATSISFIYTDAPNNYIGIILCAFICIFYIAVLYLIKKTGKIQILSQAFSVPLYASLVLSAFVSGGAEATSMQIMFLLPFMMFFTSGIRVGFLWSAIVILTEIIIFNMYWSGYQFDQHMTHAQAIEQSFVHFLVTITGLSVIAFIYERANQSLIEECIEKDKINDRLSRHDYLTGLSNRSAFFEQLEQQLVQAKRQKKNIHILIIDIQNLEKINRSFGYKKTDNIIASFAQRLKAQTPLIYSARLHGKRFALSLLSSEEAINDETINEIQQAIHQPFTSGHQIVTLQYNVSQYCANPENSIDEVMNQAEQRIDHV